MVLCNKNNEIITNKDSECNVYEVLEKYRVGIILLFQLYIFEIYSLEISISNILSVSVVDRLSR